MTKEAILHVPLEEEMKDAYLNYAMSVIVSRALPDVRDGLKPSQRRVLLAMNDLGLSPGSKTRKSAKIAGDTSANYHPHGEQVVYPTMVRLAQDWLMRYPLVEGQGNFGSIDGDPPAAPRYTEARLTPFAMMMLEDLEKDTVDFVPNYDETRDEPTVLPGKFPDLICNGSSGIAVGMATSVPPHNLGEVCDALLLLLDRPEATSDEIMEKLAGPDFPTGGIIHGRKAILEAYRSGRGTVRVRAKTHVEKTKGGAPRIVVDQVPYGINKAETIEEIAGLVKDDKLQGISDIRDESDREGIRIVFDLNKGEDPEFVLNTLFARSRLEETFSIILIALVGQRPRTLPIRELLWNYIEHRKIVVTRRTRHLLEKAKQRAHILEGLLKAIDIIDEVIATIRSSDGEPDAKANLISKFEFTAEQAEAILKMTLGRLTRLEKDKLFQELSATLERISEYNAILSDPAMLLDVLREDVHEMKEKHADDRRTEIREAELEQVSAEALIREEAVVVTLTEQGYMKRTPLDSFRGQRGGSAGVKAADVREGDSVLAVARASTLDRVFLFSERGKCHLLQGHGIPAFDKAARGKHAASLIRLAKDERITAILPLAEGDEGYIVFATTDGVVKRTPLAEFGNVQRGGIQAINLSKGERVAAALYAKGDEELLLATSNGQSIRFSIGNARPMGRSARGVAGISLSKGDRVAGATLLRPKAQVFGLCAAGYGRRTDPSEYRLQARGGAGIIHIRTTPRSGPVFAVVAAGLGEELLLLSKKGSGFRLPTADFEEMGRGSAGRKVLELGSGDRLTAAAVLSEIKA